MMVGDIVSYTSVYWDKTQRKIISEESECTILSKKTDPHNEMVFCKIKGITEEADIETVLESNLRLIQRGEPTYTCNQYFQEHPEMVLGKLTVESGPFGEKLTCRDIEDGNSLQEKFSHAAANIKGQILPAYVEKRETEEKTEETIAADPSIKNYSYAVINDEIYFRQDSLCYKQNFSGEGKARVRALIDLKEAGYALLNMELEDRSNDAIQGQMRLLNEKYDRFVASYGRINSKENQIFRPDASSGFVRALEVCSDDGKFSRKADLFSKRTVTPHIRIESVESANEALVASLSEKGQVDLNYMAKLMGNGESPETVVSKLHGIIFRDPAQIREDDAYSGYVTADAYLSGNIRNKLNIAREMAQHDTEYQLNVERLEEAMPKPLEAVEIDVRLGATWIKPEYVEAFMQEKFQIPQWRFSATISKADDVRVSYDPVSVEWHINNKRIGKDMPLAVSKYGTKRKNGLEILENSLNLRDSKVYDRVLDADGREKSVLNKKETTLCNTKAEQIKSDFESWIFNDPERRADLVKTYNEQFNNARSRSFDGSFLQFPGMNPEVNLRSHQKNAVARTLFGGNTLLAHVVGAGKTYTMAASAMEAKRIGISHKSLFVVPNHLTEQWGNEFLALYPAANILVARKEDFLPDKRKMFCSKIATGDYDAVIIGHSQFERIPLSPERQRYYVEKQIDAITKTIAEAKEQKGEAFTIKHLEKTQKKLSAKLEKLNSTVQKDDVVTFEQLGIDRLYVDESHYYKNLYLYTKMSNVAGVQQTEAGKSYDMYMKCQYIDEITKGKGITFATGTPISNSMTELYTNMRYLQAGLLKDYGLDQFDAWAANFGNVVTAVELAPEGSGYRAKKRFSSFFNIPELMNLWHEAADVQTADMLNLPVPKAHVFNVQTQPSKLQKDMVAALSDRADAIRNQKVEPSEDNMLKVTNDGRKLALDQRLIHPDMPDMENSKVNTCVNIAFSIWERTKSQHSTQMIFCDLSTPKEDGSFNVYDDIKEKLIIKGIPVKEIAFIHEAKTEVQKERLFAKVRKGEIRFLIGSTLKMGAGTNVQDHLIALHHLDVPWRPSDIEQREGRIVRQGNLNPEVEIYRYVTVDTFDAYIWQLIENKQKFISQVMTSNSPVRKCADVDDSALSYAEVKALATGNPELKEKMELDISVAKLKLERAAYESEHYHLQDECTFRLPEKIAALKARIKGMENDIAYFQEHKPSDTQQFSINVENQVYTERAAAAEALIAAARKNCTFYSKAVEVGNYIGWPLNARMEYGGGGADKYTLTIQGKVAHQFDMSQNAAANLANMTRILNMMPERLEKLETDYKDTVQALEAAKAEAERPFEKEELYQEQLMRLKELDEKLNISENADSALMAAAEEPENNNPTEFVDFGSLDEKMERWNVFENYQSEQYEDTGEALPKAEIAEVNTKDVDETKENQDTQNQEDKIEESKEERNRDKESKYQLEFSTLGNGITVWNRLAPIVSSPLDKQHMVADYETVAYISPDGKIVTFFEDKNKLPMEVCNQITEKAKEQEERYDPKQVKVASVEGSKDISNKPAEEILNLPGIENAKFMSEGFYRRYPAHGIDSGDFYSVGTSSYNEALDLYLSVETDSDRFAKLYVIAKNESAAQNIYQISEEQAEYLAYHEVLHKYGQEETLIEPMVKIGWSESAAFQDGEVLSLHEAEIRFAAYDEAQNEIRDYAGEDDEFNFGYYEKTKFYVIWETSGKLSYYEGRYDLGDGDGGLLNHIYESQRYDAEEDKSFAARASIYGQDEAIRYKNAAQDFINRTLPVLQTYLRYEIKATEPDNPKTEYQIFDRFAKQMSEEKYIYFNSPKEAKEYLESNTGSVQDMLQHHVVQETQIEKEKDAFLREKIEIALSMYYSERDKILKLADTMGYIPDTNGKMQRILALEDSDEKAGEALQKVENKFSYIANGKTIAEGLTLEQALLKYVIDYSMGAKGNYEIMHDSTCPINFVKNVRGKLVMPVEEIDKYFSLNQQPDFRKVLSTAAGKVQMLHVADPYNALQLPFDQYAAHESDNPWKNPNAMYSIAGIHMTEYQRQQLDDLNHECGHFLSSDEVRLIASGKSEKLHGNLQDSPAIRKKAEELEEVTSKFKIYTEENNYHERDMEENLCAE